MKEFIRLLGSYIRLHLAAIIAVPVSYGIFAIVYVLYQLPLEAVVYAAILTSAFLLSLALIGFAGYYRRHEALKNLKRSISVPDMHFSDARGMIEKDYQEIIRLLDQERTATITRTDEAFTDMKDYYTIWAHQIKTPIAAMRLLLQAEQSEANQDLLDQLFKVEEYVEMVLQYLRMESMSNDLLFQKYSLDAIVRQAVHKYAKLFIRKKIRLNYEALNCTVLTDEKWLVFVIEQILSNSLKYTGRGEISIYMDLDLPCTLVIEDTGIGIALEDLPRLFSRGFTGYNGRMDKKSTGIGLYLSRQILTKLSHTIRIESAVGTGTKVKIGLDTASMGSLTEM